MIGVQLMSVMQIIFASCIICIIEILFGLFAAYLVYKDKKNAVKFLNSIELKTSLLADDELNWNNLSECDLQLVNHNENIYGYLLNPYK